MLFETMRNYFSLNSPITGTLSILYKHCLCCLWPLQVQFDSFETWRQRKKLIAGCAWIHGQLTNVLNMLFDATLNRIYITTEGTSVLYAPTFFDEYGADKQSTVFAPTLFDLLVEDQQSTVFAPTLQANTINRNVVIHAPSDVYNDSAQLAELDSTINQIKPETINYSIVVI